MISAKIFISERSNSKKHVAFSAYRESSQDIRQKAIVIFNRHWINKGNTYKNRAGVLTAKQRGVYQFSAVLMTGSKQGLYLNLWRNTERLVEIWSSKQSGYKTKPISVIHGLEVGDRVYKK